MINRQAGQHKIRIAIIAGQLVIGGAERQLYLWLANLDRGRFDLIVLTLHPGHHDYWEKPIEDLNIPLYRISHRWSRLIRFYLIIKILRKFRPHLIHGWHTFASPYAGLAAKVLGSRSIGGLRSSFQTLKHMRETRLTRLLCDAVISNSVIVTDAYQQLRAIKKQSVFTVQNAVDFHFCKRAESREHLVRSYGIPPDSVWIGSIGRMDPLKRFDFLIRVALHIKQSNKNFHILLIGDGPERSTLEALARELGVQDKVTFTGEVPFGSQWLKGLDIFCFLSLDEGSPNVVMEAGAAGLPIVAWKLPFNEELLENEKMAMLVEVGDLDGLKTALSRLIQSKGLRAEIGNAAQAHLLSNFSLERYVRKMTQVYETVLEKQ